MNEKDLNPITTTYKREGDILIVERVHEKPVVQTEYHNIKKLQAKLEEIDGVIAHWQGRKKPLENIVKKYNELGR